MASTMRAAATRLREKELEQLHGAAGHQSQGKDRTENPRDPLRAYLKNKTPLSCGVSPVSTSDSGGDPGEIGGIVFCVGASRSGLPDWRLHAP
jgi:hypothetical protein